MIKVGEKVKTTAAHAVFVMLLVAGLYFVVRSGPALTGQAILEDETAITKLETALESSSMFSKVQQGSMCVYINDPEQQLSLQAKKSSAGWIVSESSGYCGGMANEDLVVQFPSYDAFSAVVDSPSPRNILGAVVRQDFQVLPSKYVEQGGNVICDATFRVKFCDALKDAAVPEKLIEGDLTCCLDTLTREEKKLLEQHLQDGKYKDEIGLVEQSPGSMNLIIYGAIGGLVVLLLAGAGAIMMKSKKPARPKADTKSAAEYVSPITRSPTTPPFTSPMTSPVSSSPYNPAQTMSTIAANIPQVQTPEVRELTEYVTGAITRGYGTDEIRAHLLEIGWDSTTADKVLSDAVESIRANQ